MLVVLIDVFVGTFVVAALLMTAYSGAASGVDQRLAPAGKEQRPRPVSDVRKVVRFSAIPWMNKCLKKSAIASRLRLLIYQSRLNWTVGQLVLMCVACGTASYYAAVQRIGSWVALGIGITACSIPPGVMMFKRSRRFARFEEELPKGLDLMVAALKAGHSFNAALGLAGQETSEPVRGELKLCFDEQHYGLGLAEAMENLTKRVPLTDLRIVATAVLIQKATGGNLAEVLSNTAEVIRERARMKRQIRVQTAHGRLTGWVIGLLPLVLFVALYIINPDLESLLWKRDLGLKLMYVGGAMMLIGCLSIRNIIRIEV